MSPAVVCFQIGDTGRQRSRRPGAPDGPGRAGSLLWSCEWSEDGPGQPRPGCDGEPALSLLLSPDDADLVGRGELAPSVAFMQGRLKTTGDNGLLLRVLAWTARPTFADALEQWRQALAGPPAP